MSDKIYAKFLGDSLNNEFSISQNLEEVKKWSGRKKKKKEKAASPSKMETKLDSFQKINEQIFEDFIAFYEIMPMLSMLPVIFPQLIIKKGVEDKFCKEGTLVNEGDEQPIYSLPATAWNDINRTMSKVQTFRSVAPVLQNFYVIGLVSHYDYFIDQIVRTLILQKPDIVINKEATIPYSDIFKLGDIERVKENLIDKEVERVLRMSHKEQLTWFSKKLDIKMEPNNELMKRFVELCERRNILTHSGGRISSTYLSNCKLAGNDCEDLEVGKTLNVSSTYIEKSVDTLIEVAFQILHVIWEKVEPNSSKKNSQTLINITFNLIREERYDIAIKLIEFLLNNQNTKMDESTRKTHLINCANAKKLSGVNDYKDLIEKEDWSACSDDYILCKYAVLDKVDDFLKLLEVCVTRNNIKKEDIRDWPVFNSMRKKEKVRKKFLELFKEPLYIDNSVQT